MLPTFTNPMIYDVRQALVTLPKLTHILCSHLISSLDNLMMAYIQSWTCSCILYIATNCNIVVFMTVCIHRYKHTTALYYRLPCSIQKCLQWYNVHFIKTNIQHVPSRSQHLLPSSFFKLFTTAPVNFIITNTTASIQFQVHPFPTSLQWQPICHYR